MLEIFALGEPSGKGKLTPRVKIPEQYGGTNRVSYVI